MTELVRAVQTLMRPKMALTRMNGDRAALCVLGPILAITDERTGEIVHLQPDERGRFGALVDRVSSDDQRFKSRYRPSLAEAMEEIAERTNATDDKSEGLSLPDLDTEAEAVDREEIAELAQGDPRFSEAVQIGKGVELFVRTGQCFFVFCDAGLPGGWPHYDPDLIRRMAEKRARRYERFHRTAVEPWPDQREATDEYRRMRVEKYFAGVEKLEEHFALIPAERRDARPRSAPKYRPALTILVDHIAAFSTVAVTELTRLVRSVDIQIALGEIFERHGVSVVGTLEAFSLSAEDSMEQLKVLLLGHLAEDYISRLTRQVIMGQVAALQQGMLYKLPRWLKRDGRGRVVADVRWMEVVRDAVALYESGLGFTGVCTAVYERHGELLAGASTVRDWIGNPLMVGDVKGYGLTLPSRHPPVLVLEDGRTADRARWQRLHEEQSRRAQEHRYGDRIPKKERGQIRLNDRAHLMTGVLYCVCGKPIGPQLKAQEKRREGTSTHICYCSANGAWRKAHPHRGIHIGYWNVEAFLDSLLTDQLDDLLASLRSGMQRDRLREQVAALEAREAAQMRAVAEARPARRAEAEAKARELMGSGYMASHVDMMLQMLLASDEEELRRLRAEGEQARSLLAAVERAEPISDVDQLRADARAAETVNSRNALLKRILTVRFSEDRGKVTADGLSRYSPAEEEASLSCYILLKVTAAPPIPVPLKIGRERGRRVITLPTSREEMLGMEMREESE
ncbi:MAG: recombinase family protein [Capsulimonadales bacterium]|nr:recombinase family protein [Capsulimonadales bacterium]